MLAVEHRDDNDSVPSTEQFVKAQSTARVCRQAALTVGHPGSQYEVDTLGFLVGKSKIDGSLQNVVPSSPISRIKYFSHYRATEGHPGARRI